MSPCRNVATILINELKKEGVLAKIYKTALTGSTYIKFKDTRIGQCRVGDHEERGRVGYRWHIRLDDKKSIVERSKGHPQYVYNVDDLSEAVKHIYNYARKIKEANGEESTISSDTK